MYIGFDLRGCGLRNNGGCRTVIKACDALNKIGHRSDIVSNIDEFSWFKHRPALRKLPDGLDVLVATASSTVGNVLKAKVPKKVWFVRGHETWTRFRNQLPSLYRSIPCIVNSVCLQRLLVGYGVESKVVCQGIDLELWSDMGIRGDKLRIGCLMGPKPTKHWDHFQALARECGDKYEYVGFGDRSCRDGFLAEYLSNPSFEELRRLYSSCHIWFAPTSLEGLHNVPMEAALCGCLLVCNSAPLSGMADYAIPNETAMVYESDQWRQAIDMLANPDFSLVEKCQQLIRDRIGSREEAMQRFVEAL